MNPKELASLAKLQLIDVRLPDDFEACHLPNAINNCVFEVSFVDQLAESGFDPSLTTVVYGANDESKEASIAAGKMELAGYTDVRILEGGIQGALLLDIATQNGPSLPDEPAVLDGRLD
ncbi:MAG: rhodanese-like domain-containing protein [Verrucomicrobia bacterium]|nr:rhodanese-like domain-containing protein [Verrucomicrobiota bacterium]